MIGVGLYSCPPTEGSSTVAKRERSLTRPPGLHTRHGNGRDDLRPASPFDRRHVERLAVLVQRVMKARSLVRAVQYRLFEK